MTGRRALLQTAVLLAVTLAGGASAAGASGGVHSDGSLGTTVVVSSNGKVTTIGGGTLAGFNLFDSFSSFSLAAGATATWTYAGVNSSSIINVINRVTGGAPSQIDGLVDTEAFPKAAFWFINPAGIVMGPGAKLDVPGAVYLSTAQQLQFADGKVFSAATPGGSILSMAAPGAFGFLGGQGNISVSNLVSENATTGAATDGLGASTVLAAANVTVSGAVFHTGGLQISAVGGGAQAVATNLAADAPALGGDISLSQSSISTAPGGAADGSIHLAGSAITLDGASLVSFASGRAPAGPVLVAAQSLTLENGAILGSRTQTSEAAGAVTVAAGAVTVDDAQIGSQTYAGGAAGAVSIQAAGEFLVDDGGLVTVDAEPGSAGPAGALTVSAGSVAIESQGALVSNTLGPGGGGQITVNASSVTLQSFGEIESSTENPPETVRMGTPGAAGSITISAGELAIETSGSIVTDSYGGPASAGDITVSAKSISIDGSGSLISSTASGSGPAGAISITTGPITISEGGAITTNAFTGPAGAIAISVQGAPFALGTPQGVGTIQTNSEAQTGGEITVSGASLVFLYNGDISAIGPAFGARVKIGGGLILESSESSIDVTGSLVFTGQLVDLDHAVVFNHIAFDDASKVLRGQCPALQARGETSQLGLRLQGPYPAEPAERPSPGALAWETARGPTSCYANKAPP